MIRYLRLLPIVAIVVAALLAMKGVDIARAAQASAQNDEPDNTGLAPADIGNPPATKDFAGDDSTAGSAATVDVMGSLTRRRMELDARERALSMRENVLSAGEARVDQKIVALKVLQGQMQALLAQRDAKQDVQIASLVKTYSAMKPKDAARIFNTLGDEVLLPVAKGMKSDVLAPVLAAMNSDAAQKLTEKLAALLKLPNTPQGICPPPSQATAASSAPISTQSTPAGSPPAAPIAAALLSPPPIAASVAPNPETPAQEPVNPAPPVAIANITPVVVTPSSLKKPNDISPHKSHHRPNSSSLPAAKPVVAASAISSSAPLSTTETPMPAVVLPTPPVPAAPTKPVDSVSPKPNQAATPPQAHGAPLSISPTPGASTGG